MKKEIRVLSALILGLTSGDVVPMVSSTAELPQGTHIVFQFTTMREPGDIPLHHAFIAVDSPADNTRQTGWTDAEGHLIVDFTIQKPTRIADLQIQAPTGSRNPLACPEKPTERIKLQGKIVVVDFRQILSQAACRKSATSAP